MNEKLRAHIDALFGDAPNTKQISEIKEEILQNTLDRYNDLLAEGKTEEEAFSIAIAGIGDVSHLIDSMTAPVASSGYTKEEIAKNKNRRSVMLSVAVALYILCVVPPIIFEDTYETLGVVLMFIIAAIATAIIIYRAGTKLEYNKDSETVVESFKEWNRETAERKSLINAVNGALWAIILIVYFAVSFFTGAWYITWLIFLIGAAITNIIKAISDLSK